MFNYLFNPFRRTEPTQFYLGRRDTVDAVDLRVRFGHIDFGVVTTHESLEFGWGSMHNVGFITPAFMRKTPLDGMSVDDIYIGADYALSR